VKVAAGAGALVLGYLGYRYVPSYFSSHNCRSLVHFRYCILAADTVFVLRILIS
jgi:hypothetical protein